MIRSREITVIPWKKDEPEQLRFHCKIHGCRLLGIPGKGYWCQMGCGPTYGKTRTVFTFNNPSV